MEHESSAARPALSAMQYRIEWFERYVRITTTGSWNAATIRRFATEILADKRWHVGLSLLADHAALDVSGVTFEQIRDSGDDFEKLGRFFGDGRCAIVAGNLLAFGLARMWEGHASRYHQMDVRVFRDAAQAEYWVEGGDLGGD